MNEINQTKSSEISSEWSSITNFCCRLFVLIIILGLLHFGRRIFVADSFVIPSESMAPTLVPGDKVWVNKLLFGARIYKSLDFGVDEPLNSFRIPGLRKIHPGDVICFNYPHGYNDISKIEFKINYVYCKRVLGCPGDRIGAVDGHYWNDRILRPLGIVMCQEKLRWTYDGVFHFFNNYEVLPQSGVGWNIKNWGPLVIPEKGLKIQLDVVNRELYKSIIEYELGSEIDSNMVDYTFTQNYYFAVGDNAVDSDDSRYWGFIPEEFIIGIVGGKKVRNNPYQTLSEEGNLD